MCATFEIRIVSGVVSKDHVHILVSAPPNMAPRAEPVRWGVGVMPLPEVLAGSQCLMGCAGCAGWALSWLSSSRMTRVKHHGIYARCNPASKLGAAAQHASAPCQTPERWSP